MDIQHRACSELVEQLNNALSIYNYSVSGELNESENGSVVIFTVTCDEAEADMYPTLELAFSRYSNKDKHEIWVAVPTLSFPTLVYNINDDYPDSIEYYLSRWADLGKAVTQINNIDFDYTDFSETDNVESATSITSAEDIEVSPGDEEILYNDPQGVLGDVDTVSLADIKTIWNNLHDSDVCMEDFSSFDEWWNATRPYLTEVNDVYSSKNVDVEATALVDISNRDAIERYLQSMILAVEEVLDAYGFEDRSITIPDEDTGMILLIQISDDEMYVEPQDVSWDWNVMERDAQDIADMIVQHLNEDSIEDESTYVQSSDLFPIEVNADDAETLGEKAAKLTGMDEWDITHLIREANYLYAFYGSGQITSVKLNQDRTRVEVTLHLTGRNEYNEGRSFEVDDDFTCEFPVVND